MMAARLIRSTIGAVVLLGGGVFAFSCARADDCPLKRDSAGHVADIDIEVTRDGAAVWNGKKLKDEAALDHCFELIMTLSPEPKFHVKADPGAPLMAQVAIMKSAQRARANTFERKP